MYYIDVYSHTSSKLVHGLYPSVIKAQTFTKQGTRKNWAYSMHKSVHTAIRTGEDKREK